MTDRRHLAAEGVRHALVATTVAVLATLLVYVFGFGSIGENFSQRVLVSLHWGDRWLSPLAFVPQDNHAANDVPYVFVDVALNDCAAATRDMRKTCRATAPLKGAELAKLLASVRDAGPRLVLVDSLVGGSAADPDFVGGDHGRAGVASVGIDTYLQQELDRQTNAVTHQPLPPILVGWTVSRRAWESEKHDGVAAVALYDADLPLLAPGAFKAARFFPTLINGGTKADRLLPALCIHLPKAYETLPEGYSTTPTLAAAAAILLSSPSGGDALARLRGYPVRAGQDSCQTAERQSVSLPGWEPATTFSETRRVLSAAPAAWQDAQNLTPTVLPPAKLLDGGSWARVLVPATGVSGLDLTVLKGAVVIVGTSDADARDDHDTAIGPISGPEMVLNDVRQMATTDPDPAPSVFLRLAQKWPLFLVGFLMAGLVGVLALKLKCFLPEEGSKRSIALVLLSFSELMVAAIVTGVGFAVTLWLWPSLLHSPPDFMTPFVAILAENIIILLCRLVGRCEHVATWAVEKLFHVELEDMQE